MPDPTIILTIVFGFIGFVVIVMGAAFLASNFYRKVGPEEAIVRSGMGGLKAITGAGIGVIPVIHRWEQMDLSVKRIEIKRKGEQGLICKDNMRADIEVAFFVRVNNTREDILQVAQALGCKRASEQAALIELFDAKFSEALKTVGKHFNFVELYLERDKFKEEILKVIGTDLNGYVLDDCAIDYLEQTPLEMMNPQNILDAEGIKKITDLTAREFILANDITREKEKTVKKQDVEAREAILELTGGSQVKPHGPHLDFSERGTGQDIRRFEADETDDFEVEGVAADQEGCRYTGAVNGRQVEVDDAPRIGGDGLESGVDNPPLQTAKDRCSRTGEYRKKPKGTRVGRVCKNQADPIRYDGPAQVDLDPPFFGCVIGAGLPPGMCILVGHPVGATLSIGRANGAAAKLADRLRHEGVGIGHCVEVRAKALHLDPVGRHIDQSSGVMPGGEILNRERQAYAGLRCPGHDADDEDEVGKPDHLRQVRKHG